MLEDEANPNFFYYDVEPVEGIVSLDGDSDIISLRCLDDALDVVVHNHTELRHHWTKVQDSTTAQSYRDISLLGDQSFSVEMDLEITMHSTGG